MNIQSATRSPARQSSAIEGRCPHGSMPGACSACSGGGGGGGGGGAARKSSGLMGWSEAYAVWKSIQVGQTRQQDYLKGTDQNRLRMQSETQGLALRSAIAGLLTRALQNAAAFGVVMGSLVGHVVSLPVRGVVQLASLVQQGVRQGLDGLAERLRQVAERLVDITDKLASILGDARKLVQDILHHNIENLKSLIARLKGLERIFQVETLVKLAAEVMRPFARSRIFRAAAETVKSTLGKFKRWFGPSDEDRPEELPS